MKKLIVATMILASTLAIAGCDSEKGWNTLKENETLVVYNSYSQLKVFNYEPHNTIKWKLQYRTLFEVETSYSTYQYYGESITWQVIKTK